MTTKLAGKFVLVTGALAESGWRVPELASRMARKSSLRTSIASGSVTLLHQSAAAPCRSSWMSAMPLPSRLRFRSCGRTLVNNAGIFDMSPVLEVKPADFDRLFKDNVQGAFFVMQAVARQMKADGKGGSIINMASQAGRQAEPASSVYAATKAAVISLTRSAAIALIKDGIRVNAIAPGVIETEMWDRIDDLYTRQYGVAVGKKRHQVGAAVPIGRMGTTDEIASVAVFLASADSKYMVGQTLNVDGGNILS